MSPCTLLGSNSAELKLSIAHLCELKSHPETGGDVFLMYPLPNMPSPALAILKTHALMPVAGCSKQVSSYLLIKSSWQKESCINKNYLSGKSGTVLTEWLKGDCPMFGTLPWRLKIRFSPLNSVVWWVNLTLAWEQIIFPTRKESSQLWIQSWREKGPYSFCRM